MEVHDDMDDEHDHIETSMSAGQIYAKSSLLDVPKQAWMLIAAYGWYMVIALVVVVVGWVKLKPYYFAWRKKQEEIQEERNFDPVKAESMQDALLRSRERMQRLHDEREAELQRKQAERAAAEREERIKQWETFKVVTKFKHPKQQPAAAAPGNYLPMGGGPAGGGGYRPPKRSVGGGGGG